MNAEDFLGWYVQQASRVYEGVFKDARDTPALLLLPPTVHESLTMLQEFGRGGKRIRGGLLTLGFQLAAGHEPIGEQIVRASVAYEILHACLLIHDDIMDRDDTRRGRDALHVAFAKQFSKWGLRGTPEHYGISMALNTGDLGVFLALEMMASLAIEPDRLVRATQKLTEIFKKTAFGQALDVTLDSQVDASEAEIMAIYEFKTAWYTVAGPLEMGAILGGGGERLVGALHDFGIPLGMAFQLEDDILGLFADENLLGKPLGSDFKEGKKTLILRKILEMSSSEDQRFVRRLIGEPHISREALERVREVARTSGALQSCTDYGRALIEKGEHAIPKITDDPEMQHTLRSFATYMIQRQW